MHSPPQGVFLVHALLGGFCFQCDCVILSDSEGSRGADDGVDSSLRSE